MATSSAAPHQAGPAEPPLLVVPGYGYEDLTAGQAEALRDLRICGQINDGHPGACVAESGHNVHGPNAGWITIFEVSLRSDQVPAGFGSSWTDGYARKCESEGATVQIQMMSTERVVHAASPAGGHLYAWVHDDMITIVVGETADDTEAFTTSYLFAAHMV
ncbi:hypothetical protein [Longivirga aurantiaca]|uniref:Uncharacterized protein n=1 Tax=Longivirga aurantiaca TaxID=1837743 RepID=A0ABW1T0E7_9ACTN